MRASQRRPQLSVDVSAADWIGERMDLAARTMVGGMVPRGFEAYARVLHPATADGGRSLTWAEVAERLGRRLTADMWFQDLADSADEVGYDFQAPSLGEIPEEVLSELMPALLADTTSTHGWFCLWEGWGSVSGAIGRMVFWPEGADPAGRASRFRGRPAFDASELVGSRLPWRPDYLLFAGRLDAIDEVGVEITWDPVDGDGVQDRPHTEFHAQTPSLFWPEDRAWCAANDIEASFTWIGGSARLIDALGASSTLDVMALGPGG